MGYRFPSIPYLKLHFHLAARQEAFLSEAKGSMLRGSFGHALRKTVCVMGPKQECRACMLRRQCVYTRLFETYIEGEPPRFLRGLDTSPRPYIFYAPDLRREYGQGEALEFDLTLLGNTGELHPYVIFAVSQMAERGFTTRQSRFHLQRVDWLLPADLPDYQDDAPHEASRTIYDGCTQCLKQVAASFPITDATPLPSPLTLRFLSPTRLKLDNQLAADFSFRQLVFKMIRRVLEIAYFYVPDAEIDWEFHEMLELADKVEIVKKNLHWEDWQRHSNRQKAEMLMGGFTGEIELQGDLAPFSALLKTCEVLHIGKGTVFGNGKIEIMRFDDSSSREHSPHAHAKA